MAQDTAGAAAAGGGTLVIPGEMAARVDRLPMSLMAWEICLIVQVGWATAAATDGIAARLYPFIWLPAKAVTHSQYDVLYAFQAGISGKPGFHPPQEKHRTPLYPPPVTPVAARRTA